MRTTTVNRTLSGAALATVISLALSAPVMAKGNPHQDGPKSSGAGAAQPAGNQPAAKGGAKDTGDSNRGDVFVQDSQSFPGNQNDPKLGCGMVYIYGDNLDDSFGALTIDSWPPSGSGTPVRGFTNVRYTYAGPGDKVIYQFPASALVSAASAQGAAPKNSQGFHFKLDISQEETVTSSIEQKHKTFWISCPAGSGAQGSEGSKAADTDNDRDVAGVNDNDSDDIASASTDTDNDHDVAGVNDNDSDDTAPVVTSTDTDNDHDVAGVNDNDSDDIAAAGSAPVLTGRPGSSPATVGGALGAHTGTSPQARPRVAGGVQGVVASAPGFLGGVLGLASTPSTGAAVPFGLGSLLALVGLGVLRSRRIGER